jgi:hypothetical protein
MPILGIVDSSRRTGDTGAMIPLQVLTVGATSVSSITFSNIPSTYAHLQLRCFNNGGVGTVIFNNDSGSNYSRHYLWGEGVTVLSGANTSVTGMGIIDYTGTSGIFSVNIVDILDYANTNKYKTVKSFSGTDTNGSGSVLLYSGLWQSTNAINTITISGGTATQYSSFALYGVKSA